MAILIDATKRVLVQEITGREGRARARLIQQYGTKVVARVTPGKGGQSVAEGQSLMIARTPGLVPDMIEEQTREKPMRRINPVKDGYDGPAARSVGQQ
jgi:succinyl-CoA synthetase alpha subunit